MSQTFCGKINWRGETSVRAKPAILMAMTAQPALVLLCLLVAGIVPIEADEPQNAAVFNFELLDTSLEGEKRGVDPAETARLRKISDLLRDKLAESGKYKIVSTTPAAQEIEDAGYLRSCNGCDARIAKKLGADLAITGYVDKVSTLILNIKIFVRDAETGTLLRAVNADIRGNTDESWAHGVRWLVRNRLLVD